MVLTLYYYLFLEVILICLCFYFINVVVYVTICFCRGTGNCLLYDGTAFTKRENVVYVAINYRLGSLGFLVNKQLGILGNFGLVDQQFALQWIQQNIAKFGGDPNQVTIVGESAGAASVIAHLISNNSQPLFHKAIVQSMPFSLPYRTIDSLNVLGSSFASKIKCSSKTCLASKTVDEILSAQVAAEDANHNLFHLILNFLPWTPAIDGKHLTQNALDAFQKGELNNVPILMGTTSEEGNMFVYLGFSSKLSKLEYNAIVGAFFFKHYWSIINMYPSTLSTSGDNREAFSILGTDYIFICPSRHAAQLLGKYQPNTYLYVFDHILSFKAWGDRYPFCEGHVCHGAELAILFGNAPLCNFTVTQDEQVYTQMMMDYWGNFIRTGNPNSNALPQWPSVATNPLELMYFGPSTQQIKPISSYKQKYCDSWDKFGYKFDW